MSQGVYYSSANYTFRLPARQSISRIDLERLAGLVNKRNAQVESESGHLALVRRARDYAPRTAIQDAQGARSYADLLRQSAHISEKLLDGASDLAEARVAFLVERGFAYVAVQWGIWRAGGVAVPLCDGHPPAELEYHVTDSEARTVISAGAPGELLRKIAGQAGCRFMDLDDFDFDDLHDGETPDDLGDEGRLPRIAASRRAMILYTSGTTSRPKGVVSTHANIRAQIEMLVEAWKWKADDSILNVLPLHHVHGIVNVLLCALWSGATCEFLPRFDASAVWGRFATGSLSLFMAVPTIYVKLIAAWRSADDATRKTWSEACRGLRLMVSGSAALPVPVLESWRDISGHVLLERYGMTEIGMALSNPLDGERRAGCVGVPLPGVEVVLLDEAGDTVPAGAPGEIHVRGPAVFHEYWCRPEMTRDAFRGGWFRTGDVAIVEDGMYRILGRMSVDIIKSGGYKISALEIEDVLLRHEAICECAVVGGPDDEWGERVACAVVSDLGVSLEELRHWARDQLAPYKLPSLLMCVDELPRNALGKVTKPAVAELFSDG